MSWKRSSDYWREAYNAYYGHHYTREGLLKEREEVAAQADKNSSPYAREEYRQRLEWIDEAMRAMWNPDAATEDYNKAGYAWRYGVKQGEFQKYSTDYRARHGKFPEEPMPVMGKSTMPRKNENLAESPVNLDSRHSSEIPKTPSPPQDFGAQEDTRQSSWFPNVTLGQAVGTAATLYTTYNAMVHAGELINAAHHGRQVIRNQGIQAAARLGAQYVAQEAVNGFQTILDGGQNAINMVGDAYHTVRGAVQAVANMDFGGQ